ncbi:hypothetical protein I5M32_08000 [Pedobacter sp. SD-b]|uniref:Uncharacterized protein n=1 Tax=Pedobacter segetis TaxID=2793069 RepID=A0ABS1BJ54_9SPHI|nr:hypothetical protein [Pedobacter segetis]MBK0382900.1 hypothetical protein [Pedobacter segetis]
MLKKNVLKIQLFRTDVQDCRSDSSGLTAYSRKRLLIDFLNIIFKGTVLKEIFIRIYTGQIYTREIEATEGKISLPHIILLKKCWLLNLDYSTFIIGHGFRPIFFILFFNCDQN